MRKRQFAKHAGFSLWEVLVALVIVAIITAALVPTIASTFRYTHKENTQNALLMLQRGMRDAYRDYAMAIDDYTGNRIRFNSEYAFATGAGIGTSNGSTVVQTGFNLLSDYLGSSAAHLARDAYGNSFYVFVSKRLQKKWHDYTVYYHDIAFVSSMGTPDTGQGSPLNNKTSFNKNTGQLKLGGRDQGIVVSGYPLQVEKYRKTLSQMRHIADQYEAFYHAQMGSRGQDVLTDYFSAPCHPTSGGSNVIPVKNTCGHNSKYPGGTASFDRKSNGTCYGLIPVSDNSAGLSKYLGLTSRDSESAWGFPIAFGHSADAKCAGVTARTPDASSAANRRPPFTALIQSWAPGGVPLVVVANSYQ